MLNKNLLLALLALIACSNSSAEQESLEDSRKAPDTSNTVYMTGVPSEGRASQLEGLEKKTNDLNQNEAVDNSNSSGTFVSQGNIKENGLEAKQLKETQAGGVLTNLTATPYATLQAKVEAQSNYSGNELDIHGSALAANCLAVKSAGSKDMAVVNFGESLFVIPTKQHDLPLFPEGGGKTGVHGVDKNLNCVRDDIEHYVFNKYPNKDQERLRLNLYKYSIWLNFFLINPISDKIIQGISRQDIKTGKCIDTLIGQRAGTLARGDLFAHQHNTDERTNRYFENMEVLRGFMIEDDIIGPCS
jgi:hypothetical protein